MERYTLVGCDGNAFAVMGYVCRAFDESGRKLNRSYAITKSNKDNYVSLAKSGNYNELLALSMEVLDDINDSLEKAGLINTKKISPIEALALLKEQGYEVEL